MKGLRFFGCVACVCVALDCFAHDAGGLPYWVWFVAGLAWLAQALRFMVQQ